MRRLLPTSLGLFSFAAGLLFISRDEDNALRSAQIVVNELSWVSSVVGILAVAISLLTKPRSLVALLTGSIGAALTLKPFLVHRAVAIDASSAMRAGLGSEYESRIPPAIRTRLQPSVWSWGDAFGARHRQSCAKIERDVMFAAPAGHRLKLDMYKPHIPPAIGGAYPAIIVIHGGGWRNGDKSEYFEWHNFLLASQGYVVFDIQYRLSGQAKWPAQLHDIHTAIRWVKQSASAYQVDPQRLALLGRSSGAHLALMAAFRAGLAEQVNAVISVYGPANMKWEALPPGSPIVELLGGTWEDLPDDYTDANPLDWVRDDLPPLLVVEAGMDNIVPRVHGDRLSARLSTTNTRHVLLRVPWSRHGFDAVPYGLGAQLVQYHMDRFLAYVLYGGS